MFCLGHRKKLELKPIINNNKDPYSYFYLEPWFPSRDLDKEVGKKKVHELTFGDSHERGEAQEWYTSTSTGWSQQKQMMPFLENNKRMLA